MPWKSVVVMVLPWRVQSPSSYCGGRGRKNHGHRSTRIEKAQEVGWIWQFRSLFSLSMPRCTDRRWPIVLCLTMLLPRLAIAEDPALPLVSVCELANDPTKYSGKMIRLQGEIAFGPHGSGLFDRLCPTMSLGGYTWGNAVCFGTAIAEVERDPFEWAGSLYRSRVDRKRYPKMEAILVGELGVAQSFDHTVVIDGRATMTGFCHGGRYPFQLTVNRLEFLSFREFETPEGRAAEPRK